MEPVSRSTNGTHAPAPAATPEAPGGPAVAPPNPPPDPPRDPATDSTGSGEASALSLSLSLSSLEGPPGASGNSLDGRSGQGRLHDPPGQSAASSSLLGAPPRSAGATWWAGPMRASRPLDRLSGLSQALVGDALLRHVAGRRVLDLGQGSPEIARWVRATAASLESVDVRLATTDAGEIRLPHPPDRYDVVYSVRTLAHLGRDEASSDLGVRSLLAEAARVLAPGGLLLVEINNPRSLRGLAYGIRRPITIVAAGSVVVAERQHVTRYDTLSRLVRMAPRNLELVHVYGIRVLVPISRALQIPLLGRLLAAGEWWARDGFLRRYGAHLLVALRRRDEPISRPAGPPATTG
jgi:SAM-dependent methyltransferase